MESKEKNITTDRDPGKDAFLPPAPDENTFIHEGSPKNIKKYKERFFAFLLIAGLVFAFFVLFSREKAKNEFETAAIEIGDTKIAVEIADTSEERTLGLGGRDGMPDTEGMFFIFEESGTHPFWMKNMEFPLDIIWIGEDFGVADIKENISPDTFPKQYVSSLPSKYVLEVNAGFARAHSVATGSAVIFNRKGAISK